MQVTVYINPDGSVTFADLAQEMESIAVKLSAQEKTWNKEGISKAWVDTL